MPIDPNIALSVRPVQLPDIAKTYGEGLQIQNMIQQRQMNTEKLRSERRANQLADEDAADTEKMRQAYQMANGKPDETIQHAIRLGAGPKAIQSTQQHFADYAKKIADTKAAELPGMKYRDEQMLGLHDQAIQQATADPQAFAANYPQIYAAAVKIDPEAAKHLDPNTPPTLDQLKMSQLGYNTHLTFIGQEEEKRKQAEALQKAAEEKRRALLFPSQLKEAQGKPDLQVAQTNEARLKATAAQREEDATTLAAAHAQGPEAFAAAMAQLPSDRAAIFSGISDKPKADDILNLGRSPQQRMAGGNVNEWELYLRAADGNEKQALKDYQRDRVAAAQAGRDPNAPADRAVARLDREVGQYGKPFDEASKNADAQLEKILEAEKLVAGGSVSQAMAIPKILQAIMSTGSSSGSGVRTTINQAEMNRVAKARGIAGDIEGFFSKAAGQGELTKDQKTQMNGLLSDIRQSITEKKQIASDAADEMRSASSREEILAAEKKGRTALAAHAAKGGGAALSTGHKIGDVVNIGGKNYKITKLLPNDKFEADEVK